MKEELGPHEGDSILLVDMPFDESESDVTAKDMVRAFAYLFLLYGGKQCMEGSGGSGSSDKNLFSQ